MKICMCMMQESEMSEEDYKRLQEARRQHEDELKARRELRAIRRKASQAKAAAEKAATAAAPMVTSSNPVRERTRSGKHMRHSCQQCSLIATCLRALHDSL